MTTTESPPIKPFSEGSFLDFYLNGGNGSDELPVVLDVIDKLRQWLPPERDTLYAEDDSDLMFDYGWAAYRKEVLQGLTSDS